VNHKQYVQKRAFQVYKSSAGSGKTTALVKVFLKLSLETGRIHDFKSILAITFTNKAANELKDRFLESLKSLASLKEDDEPGFLVRDLVRETGLTFRELKLRASKIFRMALRDYGDISIGTIDGFNHKLIRSFSRELHLAGDFDVELEEAKLFAEAVELLLDDVGKNEYITKHLVNYLNRSIEDDERANIPEKLRALRPLVAFEDARQGVDSLRETDPSAFENIRKHLKQKMESFERKIRSLGQQALFVMGEAGVDDEDLIEKSRGIFKYFNDLAAFSDGRITITEKRAKKLEGSWANTGASKDRKALVAGVEGELRELFYRAEKLQESEYPDYALAKDLISRIDLLAVIKDLHEDLRDLIDERNILPISDFNRIISDSIRDEPVAYIYEKFGARYRNILIDEFQDTSELQWKNLTPFVAESLSAGNLSMVVGDAKQSIYRWRGGKAEQLIRLPELDPDDQGIAMETRNSFLENAEIRPLDTNFRSLGNIVKFNNALVASITPLMTEEGTLFRKEYTGVSATQKYPEGREGGYVEISRISGEKAKEYLVENTLRCIDEALSDGYEYGDIAVLIRKRGQEVFDLVDALHKRNIPISTKDSFGLDKDMIVDMLIAFLRLNVSPDSEAAKVKIMRALCFLHDLPYQPYEFLKAKKPLSLMLEEFLNLHFPSFRLDGKKTLGAWEFTNWIISELVPEAERGNLFVESFLNCILEQGGRSLSSLAFLEWWDELKENKPEAKTEGKGNQVEIMTIHKAKGLEFPVVIIPDLSWRFDNYTNERWVAIGDRLNLPFSMVPLKLTEKALEPKGLLNLYEEYDREVHFDNLNLLYVALTRPSERLYAAYTMVRKNYTGGPIAAALEILKSRWDQDAPFDFSYREKALENEEVERQIMTIGQKTSPEKGSEGGLQTQALSTTPPMTVSFDKRFRVGTESISEPREAGILFHRLAEHSNSLEEAEKMIRIWRANGRAGEKVLSEVEGLIEALFSDTKYRSIIRNEEKLSERTLTTKEGILIPDAVFKSSSKFTVIDFKTGSPKPDHIRQVNLYLSTIKGIWNMEGEGYVLYLPEARWVKAGEDRGIQGELF